MVKDLEKKKGKSSAAVVSTRGLKSAREGIVVSDKMDKTIVVAVKRKVRHAMYAKFITRTKKYLAHDEKEECSVGDLVKIVGTRPLSARKCWKLDEIVRKAPKL